MGAALGRQQYRSEERPAATVAAQRAAATHVQQQLHHQPHHPKPQQQRGQQAVQQVHQQHLQQKGRQAVQQQQQRQPQQRRSAAAPHADGRVLYLAYGSNMAPSVLTTRRGVRPRASWPARVPGYALSFGMHGLPFSEPGFATIAPQPQHGAAPTLHGVLHLITRREWEVVQATEGVSSGDASSSGYQVVSVECQRYDGSTVSALTLQGAPASLHGQRPVLPSRRYLSLLREGAAHHGVDGSYQAWLACLQPYTPPGELQSALGALASGAVLLSAASTALPAYAAGRAMGLLPGPAAAGRVRRGQQQRSEGGLLPYMRWHLTQSARLMWHVHDAALAPLLGSGCSNEPRR